MLTLGAKILVSEPADLPYFVSQGFEAETFDAIASKIGFFNPPRESFDGIWADRSLFEFEPTLCQRTVQIFFSALKPKGNPFRLFSGVGKYPLEEFESHAPSKRLRDRSSKGVTKEKNPDRVPGAKNLKASCSVLNLDLFEYERDLRTHSEAEYELIPKVAARNETHEKLRESHYRPRRSADPIEAPNLCKRDLPSRRPAETSSRDDPRSTDPRPRTRSGSPKNYRNATMNSFMIIFLVLKFDLELAARADGSDSQVPLSERSNSVSSSLILHEDPRAEA